MIVNRQIWVVREEHTIEEAMELFKGYPPDAPQATRVLSPSGLIHQESIATLIFEFEYDSLAAMLEQWSKLSEVPGWRPFMEKWRAVCERNSQKSDVWRVVQ